MSDEIDLEKLSDAWEAYKNGDFIEVGTKLHELARRKGLVDEDDLFDWAERLLKRRMRWYRERLFEEALARWANGDFKSREEFDSALLDRAANMMVHTNVAMWMLACVEDPDAWVDRVDEIGTRDGIAWSEIAAQALRAEVENDLFAKGIDGATVPPTEKSRLCPGCDKWERWWEGGDDTCCRECSDEGSDHDGT